MADSKKNVIFTTLLIEKSPQALPLGAACCASALKHNDLTKDLYNVFLVPFCREDADYKKHSQSEDTAANYIAQEILKKEPSLVAFSVYVWNRIILEKVAAILKSKEILTIAGGPEITAHPEIFTVFDSVTTGEGEFKVPQIVFELLSEDKNNTERTVDQRQRTVDQRSVTVLQRQGTVDQRSVTVPQVQFSLDKLESPYLDGTLDPSDYEGALWELARGCPFKCSYCYESKGEKTVRMFPMERIEKELDLFAKKKIPQVFVLDPTYNANKKRALDLLNLIAKKTPDTFYYFEARAEFLDRQMAKAFTKIPCALQIGLQTADENVARLVNRPFNRKIFQKNINILNEEGVIFGLDVIYGLPGDSLRGYKDSVDFAINLYPNNLELFCLSVLPGTDLYDRAKDLHLTYETEPPYHIINTDRFSKADIEIASHIAQACSFFYNEGRAVPWFNTICHALRQRPSQFFEHFYTYYTTLPSAAKDCSNHLNVEKVQKDYVRQELNNKKLGRLVNAALDIITYNGACSRKMDTGKSETISLHYPVDYIASEYSLDLEFFVNNVKMKNNNVKI